MDLTCCKQVKRFNKFVLCKFHKTAVYKFARSLFVCLFNKQEFICLCPVWILCLNSTRDSVCKVWWKVRLYFQIRDRNFFSVSPAQNVCATFFVLCVVGTITKICLCLEIRLPSSSKSFSLFPTWQTGVTKDTRRGNSFISECHASYDVVLFDACLLSHNIHT